MSGTLSRRDWTIGTEGRKRERAENFQRTCCRAQNEGGKREMAAEQETMSSALTGLCPFKTGDLCLRSLGALRASAWDWEFPRDWICLA